MQRTGEKLREELIATLGHIDADLPVYAPIKLGGAPRARTLAARQTSKRHLEQSSSDQAIEVEGGETAADGERPGSFVAGDIVALPADVCIDRTTPRIAQGADGLDVRVDVTPHGSNNSSNWF